jgi:hypothetical protein
MGPYLKEKEQLDLQDAQLNLRIANTFIVQNQFSKAFSYLNSAVVISPEIKDEASACMKMWYKEAQNYLQKSAHNIPLDLLLKHNLMLLNLAASQNINIEIQQDALRELKFTKNFSKLSIKK